MKKVDSKEEILQNLEMSGGIIFSPGGGLLPRFFTAQVYGDSEDEGSCYIAIVESAQVLT